MGAACVGNSEGVVVGVNNSAPSCVGVGVKVSGVLVEVANIFRVGAGVLVGANVAVTGGGGGGVGVMIMFARSASEAQLERKIVSTTMCNFFFMEWPFEIFAAE